MRPILDCSCFAIIASSTEWDETVRYGVDGQAGKRVNLEFADDVTAVGVDCVDRYEQLSCNLLVRHALDQTNDDFLLAFGDGFLILSVANHAGDAGGHIVVLQLLFQDADGWNEEYFLYVAVVREPFLVVVDVVERGCQLVVGESVVRQVLDDDVLQLVELACGVAVMLREDVHVVIGLVLAPQQCLDVWEERLLFVLHVQPDIVGVLIVESHYQHNKVVSLVQGLLELLPDGRQLEVQEIAVRGSQIVEQRLYGDFVVGRLRGISVDEEVDHGKESIAVDALSGTNLTDGLVTEAQPDAKGAKALQHTVIVADEVNHLVISLV